MKITAQTIVDLLAEKHSSDVFIRECKDGPSVNNSHCRLDAWAMKRSWSSPCTYGYEVKVSRQDFLKDDKWRNYLPYCNEFYFAATKGLIQLEELPEGIDRDAVFYPP
jgi:hypothetical protein